MSRASGDAHCPPACLHAIDRRAVEQIQRSVVKLGKRNAVSRLFHATSDKDTVASWRSELDRILQVFKVRSTASSPLTPLTIDFQTELAVHTDVTVTETRHDVAYTREVVSDIQRAVVKVQEGIDIRNQTVGSHYALFVVPRPLQLFRLQPG